MALRCLQTIAQTSPSKFAESVLAVSEHAILWRLCVSRNLYDHDAYDSARLRMFSSMALRFDDERPPLSQCFSTPISTFEYFITPIADLTTNPMRHATFVLSSFAPNKRAAAFATATRLFAVEDLINHNGSSIIIRQAVALSPLFDGDVECSPCSDWLRMGGFFDYYSMVFLNEEQSSDGKHYVFLVSAYDCIHNDKHVIKRYRIRQDGNGRVEEVDCVFNSQTSPFQHMRLIVAETRCMKTFMDGHDLMFLDEEGTWQRRRVEFPRSWWWFQSGLRHLFEPLSVFGMRYTGTLFERILWVSATGRMLPVYMDDFHCYDVKKSRDGRVLISSNDRLLMGFVRGGLPTLLEAARGACCAFLTERKLLKLQQKAAFDFQSFLTFVDNL